MKNEISIQVLNSTINDFLTLKKINDKEKSGNHFFIVDTIILSCNQAKTEYSNAISCIISSMPDKFYFEKTKVAFGEFNDFLRNYFVGQSIKKNK
jgi:hypothetical protein